MESNDRLELFFSQSLDGFFFMMLDEPIAWDDSIDKEKALDYVFEHQRVTKVNDAMLAQYGATRETFLGTRPKDLFKHDIAYGRKIWREFFDRGRLHIETDQGRIDGTPIPIEGDYLCFYDEQGRITGHFGIQRDVTQRDRADKALRRFKRPSQAVAEVAVRHVQSLIPCRRVSVAVINVRRAVGQLIALHDDEPATQPREGAVVPLEAFGVVEHMQACI